jgi:hypothetical protein
LGDFDAKKFLRFGLTTLYFVTAPLIEDEQMLSAEVVCKLLLDARTLRKKGSDLGTLLSAWDMSPNRRH